MQPDALTRLMQQTPIALVILRGLLGPILLLAALTGHTGPWFLVGFLIGFFSDIFDGILARRLGVSTAALRRADSWADTGFYLCIFVSAWWLHPELVRAFALPLELVVAAQGLWWMVNLAKYGKPASYHTYSAKLWGITLAIAVICWFGFGYAGIALWLAIGVGLLHTIEEIAMTLILPTWQHDVLSFWHALKSDQLNSENQ